MSVASAVRDLRAQLQRNSVTVGPLESFFKFGKDHTASVIGDAHSVNTSGGSVTATVLVEVTRTAPSGNPERRRSQVTFRVLGSGESAKAQAISAGNLQRP
jgi:hypothetical protein